MPGVKVAIGIGGTFDYLSGGAKRAPRWLRKLGLEWLYRLIKEPKRLGRIWRATAVFGWWPRYLSRLNRDRLFFFLESGNLPEFYLPQTSYTSTKIASFSTFTG